MHGRTSSKEEEQRYSSRFRRKNEVGAGKGRRVRERATRPMLARPVIAHFHKRRTAAGNMYTGSHTDAHTRDSHARSFTLTHSQLLTRVRLHVHACLLH